MAATSPHTLLSASAILGEDEDPEADGSKDQNAADDDAEIRTTLSTLTTTTTAIMIKLAMMMIIIHDTDDSEIFRTTITMTVTT